MIALTEEQLVNLQELHERCAVEADAIYAALPPAARQFADDHLPAVDLWGRSHHTKYRVEMRRNFLRGLRDLLARAAEEAKR